eukprot:scaffold91_cov254-Pinguiococcus_pyrenoidosus.AAC.35
MGGTLVKRDLGGRAQTARVLGGHRQVVVAPGLEVQIPREAELTAGIHDEAEVVVAFLQQERVSTAEGLRGVIVVVGDEHIQIDDESSDALRFIDVDHVGQGLPAGELVHVDHRDAHVGVVVGAPGACHVDHELEVLPSLMIQGLGVVHEKQTRARLDAEGVVDGIKVGDRERELFIARSDGIHEAKAGRDGGADGVAGAAILVHKTYHAADGGRLVLILDVDREVGTSDVVRRIGDQHGDRHRLAVRLEIDRLPSRDDELIATDVEEPAAVRSERVAEGVTRVVVQRGKGTHDGAVPNILRDVLEERSVDADASRRLVHVVHPHDDWEGCKLHGGAIVDHLDLDGELGVSSFEVQRGRGAERQRAVAIIRIGVDHTEQGSADDREGVILANVVIQHVQIPDDGALRDRLVHGEDHGVHQLAARRRRRRAALDVRRRLVLVDDRQTEGLGKAAAVQHIVLVQSAILVIHEHGDVDALNLLVVNLSGHDQLAHAIRRSDVEAISGVRGQREDVVAVIAVGVVDLQRGEQRANRDVLHQAPDRDVVDGRRGEVALCDLPVDHDGEVVAVDVLGGRAHHHRLLLLEAVVGDVDGESVGIHEADPGDVFVAVGRVEGPARLDVVHTSKGRLQEKVHGNHLAGAAAAPVDLHVVRLRLHEAKLLVHVHGEADLGPGVGQSDTLVSAILLAIRKVRDGLDLRNVLRVKRGVPARHLEDQAASGVADPVLLEADLDPARVFKRRGPREDLEGDVGRDTVELSDRGLKKDQVAADDVCRLGDGAGCDGVETRLQVVLVQNVGVLELYGRAGFDDAVLEGDGDDLVGIAAEICLRSDGIARFRDIEIPASEASPQIVVVVHAGVIHEVWVVHTRLHFLRIGQPARLRLDDGAEAQVDAIHHTVRVGQGRFRAPEEIGTGVLCLVVAIGVSLDDRHVLDVVLRSPLVGPRHIVVGVHEAEVVVVRDVGPEGVSHSHARGEVRVSGHKLCHLGHLDAVCDAEPGGELHLVIATHEDVRGRHLRKAGSYQTLVPKEPGRGRGVVPPPLHPAFPRRPRGEPVACKGREAILSLVEGVAVQRTREVGRGDIPAVLPHVALETKATVGAGVR